MLNAKIILNNVNYEETFRTLFPKLRDKVMTLESDRLPIRFVQKLGESARTVTLALLAELEEQHKTKCSACASTTSGRN